MLRSVLARIGIVVGLVCLAWWSLDAARTTQVQRERSAALDRLLRHDATPPSGIIVVPHSTIGRIEIPRLHLSSVIVEGDDDETLAHAVGHLPDTPMPWEPGNSGLAGHRDTFFFPLRDLKEGDDIQLTTLARKLLYKVDGIQITSPDDVGVLMQTRPGASLTLVTCYPFYYVGAAPKRFIVHARRVSPAS